MDHAFAVNMQEELRPILLRRMKEDVENLPEKEEVVVWVQLTHQQRAYYKALYSNQVSPSECTAMHILPSAYSLSVTYVTCLQASQLIERALQCRHDA